MKKWLWLTVSSIVLFGFFSLMELGSTYLGKSYTDSLGFKNQYADFEDQLLAMELDPPAVESATPVTLEDVEEYRSRFGSLADQIKSIQDQYNADIEEANTDNNESLAEALTAERDEKIDAIRSNFSDDEVVREKIQAEREAVLEQVLNELNNEKPVFLENSRFYVYELTNTETGETFTKGELKTKPYFEKTYTAGNPLGPSDRTYYNSDMLNGTVIDIPDSTAKFTGTVQIDRSLLAASGQGDEMEHFTFVQTFLYILGALTLAGTVLLLTVLKFEKSWFAGLCLYRKWKGWPLEIRFLLIFFSIIFGVSTSSGIFSTLVQIRPDEYVRYGLGLAWEFLLALFFIAASILQIIWLVTSYRDWNSFSKDVKNSSIFKRALTARHAFLKKSIGVQMLILLAVIFFWGFGTLLIFVFPPAIIVWIPATLFIGIPVLLFMMNRFGYLNVLMQGTEDMAQGRLNQELPVRGKSPLADHARQLNRLKEGVRHSMSEQAKSERLKTELITNVSHDLRTPLTSIITYTDLMKTPDLPDESRLAYADILDRKSQRLKTLIEDLFEVSKMASGNVELNRARLDLTQLMTQALAEHEEEIAASGLDFRVNSPEKPLYIHADGQKWWRVLDNLIVNAIKYSLPGTRVYVSLDRVDGQAEFVMKNVTRYELGENTDELFERFKRGDVSRQTEGSGLGLAIAQSIVDLHGGVMKVEVDGDLFKITVSVNSLK